jgi:hypothetical protein
MIVVSILEIFLFWWRVRKWSGFSSCVCCLSWWRVGFLLGFVEKSTVGRVNMGILWSFLEIWNFKEIFEFNVFWREKFLTWWKISQARRNVIWFNKKFYKHAKMLFGLTKNLSNDKNVFPRWIFRAKMHYSKKVVASGQSMFFFWKLYK